MIVVNTAALRKSLAEVRDKFKNSPQNFHIDNQARAQDLLDCMDATRYATLFCIWPEDGLEISFWTEGVGSVMVMTVKFKEGRGICDETLREKEDIDARSVYLGESLYINDSVEICPVESAEERDSECLG